MSSRWQTRECSIDQLQPELLRLAKRYISSIDRVLICLETTSPGACGVFGNKTSFSAALCTQSRVVSVEHFYTMEDKYEDYTRTMELLDIATIQEDQYEFGRGVQLSGGGGAKLGFTFDLGEASYRFANILRGATEQAKRRTSKLSQSPSNFEDRIRFLKKLRQDGTITESQFQQKLQEIVDQL